MTSRPPHIPISVFGLFAIVLFLSALANYAGRGIVYIVFSVVLNTLLVSGFTKGRIYFDTFIGIFFWLGFWVKYSLRIAFLGGEFQAAELIGNFSGTGAEHDHSLIVASCGIVGLLIANFVRRKFIFSYAKIAEQDRLESIFTFYQENRRQVLIMFLSLFVIIAVTNVLFGIYQRGSMPRTILPFGLSGVYTWLLLFGLTSLSGVILDCEFRLKNNPYLVTVIGVLETFFSNVSMLSRGMILNGGSLLIGLHDNAKKRSHHPGLRYKVLVFIIFITLFVSSVFVANHMRKHLFYSDFPATSSISKSIVLKSFKASILRLKERIRILTGINLEFVDRWAEPVSEALAGVENLLVDRWVGIEGVMSVSTYHNLGWDLWKKAWQEKYTRSGTSMYDLVILRSPFGELRNHHFISLPGIVAFFYFPGSLPFLCFSMILLGLIAAGVELFVFKTSGANIILCCVIGQVVAYRYAHFGYVPNQSYLLFGSIFLNVLILYFLNKVLFKLSK